MPELPEVETTLRGIKQVVKNAKITDAIIRHPKLRFPIPANLADTLRDQPINDLTRRGKYILFHLKIGTLILHLGMSGRVRILTEKILPQKHDHVDIIFDNEHVLRFTDPRRFGALLFTHDHPEEHPLLAHLGPEPLTKKFDGDYLLKKQATKKSRSNHLSWTARLLLALETFTQLRHCSMPKFILKNQRVNYR